MSVKRAVRIAERIKRELSRILLFEVKDPGVKHINISEVKLTDDLSIARIFYTVFNQDTQREQAEKSILRASKFIRSEISKSIDLKFVPELEFVYDPIPEHTAKLDNLFNQIRDEEE